jgi:hypothetical protein
MAGRAARILGRSNLVDAHTVDRLTMLRSGHVDIALIFRHADTHWRTKESDSPTCSTTPSMSSPRSSAGV